MTDTNAHCFEVDVQASADRVWRALVDPDLTQQYYFHTRVDSDWKVGSSVSYRDPEGRPAVTGKILEIDPPGRLVTTFEPKWMPAEAAGPVSTVIWEITPKGTSSTLKLTHLDLDPSHPLTRDIQVGWPPTLNGLKNVLENSKN